MNDLFASRHILVRCPNWVGDLIMATPLFQCLRDNLPGVQITALTRSYNAKIIEDAPWVDNIIPCQDKSIKGLLSTARQVHASGADTAILLPNSLRSYLPIRIGGVRRVFGYRRGGRRFLVRGPLPVMDDQGVKPIPMVDYYLDLCRWLGLDVADQPTPSLFVSSNLEEQATRLLDRYGIRSQDRVVGLNPGAKFGSSKCWPPEFFARLAELLEEFWDCKILLFVGPGETPIADQIMSMTKAKVINTDPDHIDLGLLKPMVRRCDLLITNDTGPRHYATAFKRPVVVIMGPTDPRYTNSNLDQTIVLRKDLPCAPCHQKECSEDHECMRGITPDEVMDAALRLVSTGQETPKK